MRPDFDGPSLPLRASGTFAGFRWELRGEVIGDSVYEWTSVDALNRGGGNAGGGIGAMPFAGWIGWFYPSALETLNSYI
jgi:hypothetical protein